MKRLTVLQHRPPVLDHAEPITVFLRNAVF